MVVFHTSLDHCFLYALVTALVAKDPAILAPAFATPPTAQYKHNEMRLQYSNSPLLPKLFAPPSKPRPVIVPPKILPPTLFFKLDGAYV
jgi:hypothetical protein